MKKLLIAGLFCALCAAWGAERLIAPGERVAFVGDSITEFGADRPDGYVRLVEDGLRRNHCPIVVLAEGRQGDKSNQILARLPQILAKKPNWILISCGVNDVLHGNAGVELEPYKENMRKIFDAADAVGAKVMVLTPTCCSEQLGDWANQKLAGYCQFLREESARRHYPLADLNRRMRLELDNRHPERTFQLTIDNLHMNGYGNQMMALEILQTLGLSAEETAALLPEWNRIPSMPPMLNMWAPYKVSIDDYEILSRAAQRRGLNVSQYALEVLRFHAKELAAKEVAR